MVGDNGQLCWRGTAFGLTGMEGLSMVAVAGRSRWMAAMDDGTVCDIAVLAPYSHHIHQIHKRRTMYSHLMVGLTVEVFKLYGR